MSLIPNMLARAYILYITHHRKRPDWAVIAYWILPNNIILSDRDETSSQWSEFDFDIDEITDSTAQMPQDGAGCPSMQASDTPIPVEAAASIVISTDENRDNQESSTSTAVERMFGI